MSAHAPGAVDEDTRRIPRPASTEARGGGGGRLARMGLHPPSGPVPEEVLAYFELAVAREVARERRRRS